MTRHALAYDLLRILCVCHHERYQSVPLLSPNEGFPNCSASRGKKLTGTFYRIVGTSSTVRCLPPLAVSALTVMAQ